MGQNGAIRREQFAPPGHERGAFADAQMLEQQLDVLHLVARDFNELLLRLEEDRHGGDFKRQRLIHCFPFVGVHSPAGDARLRGFASKVKRAAVASGRQRKDFPEKPGGTLDPCSGFT